ncbi:hypothetical protein [Nocardia sp. alder85J]|uniref:hypothetical protein n=1 Tax=Nocardia sp. alder85J TaxID=2862949 RepID=UPI001CD54EAF|nr:hypothetical protein [Nocardia sp. alder85J]MCX4093591.1 hypothetical protein [Nocardia sp. alder85J]
MPEKFGGKTFYTSQEAAERGSVPSPEEIARADQAFEEFNTRRSTAAPAPEGSTPGFGGRFSDDLEGTEFEGWTRDPATNQWFDQHGYPVRYDEGHRIPDGSTEP